MTRKRRSGRFSRSSAALPRSWWMGFTVRPWRACQDLVAKPEELRVPDGYKKVFAALQQIEKVSVIKATEAFDTYFEKCYRKRGQPAALCPRRS